MHTTTLKKLALALTFWLALHLAPLKAQLLTPTSNSNASLGVDADGLLYDTGTFGTGTLSLSGAGTRMFWYPGKAAFRAGEADSTGWNDANIGHYSVAFGLNTTASGAYSVAMGAGTTASGSGSTASGRYTTASGNFSTAVGQETTASGAYSTASGINSNATGEASTALGNGTASGFVSTALGLGTSASGDYSTASGNQTSAGAQCSFVAGAFNLDLSETGATPSPTTWVATDPLFEIGNGGGFFGGGNPATTGPSDAFVVYKNGDVAAQGVITSAPGGDIPMYTGN